MSKHHIAVSSQHYVPQQSHIMSDTFTATAYAPSSCLFERGSAETLGCSEHNLPSFHYDGNGQSACYDMDEEQDQMVDLSTGSLVPVNLRSWNLMAEVVQKLRDL
ncbi:hypothetical protein HG535_0C01140 [Zygotorulaspora mrakii]|uniref:Uncharacterized protein n=1 Tax=Zygotorulaspora mrakii TaxID=42260 RepID=A0A7H9AZB7_ZYGMR|nr:uncharacterized protein HG535_0C01140 [Zygotorulaspora mrakii]QLG71765.1 hypothetical protein HG535_0C01140 [Zygotorulaspora mrakii]